MTNRVQSPDEIPEEQRPLHAAARRFLIKMWDSSLFTVMRRADGVCIAHFSDDGTEMPVAEMAYNHEIGLFLRSAFPDEIDEDE